MKPHVLSLVALLFPAALAAADRPNVVVILADDQGWGDLRVNGNTNLATPHIDSLAKDGALFERFYVCPVCSPTRAEFLTGRYHPRGGVRGVSTGGERLNLAEKTVADAFRAAEYATGCFGKWHNGSQYPYHPNGRGFTEYYGFTSGHWGDYFDPPLEHNGRPVRGKGFLADDLTDRAIGFIESNRGRPFFCYLAYNTPHSPMQVPDKFYAKFKDADLKLRHPGPQKEDVGHTRAALAMCENIDWNVGRLLRALDGRKLAGDTIVVYFSDNGPNGWRWNGGMKGRKGSTDEGGVRSPLHVRWPGHVKPGTRVTPIAGAIDLLPTLTELAGVKRVGDKPLDGRSLAALLLGKGAAWPDRVLFSHWNGKVSARTQRYRLDADGKLFDMVADPGQARDVAAGHPDVTRRLTEAVAGWKKDVLGGLTRKDDRPFPVGFRESPVTWLPARDGVPHGNVRRSAPAPNCSYFTNWTSPDDRITWDVEVATAGRYEVELLYACAKENVGATIELGFRGGRLSGKVTEAHDPPLRGAEHDRVPRAGESYVKDFKPFKLGVVELPRGRGELTLRATDIPGKRVIEVRAVTLTLSGLR
jgi:arylsulfatase A-like enzyme